MESKIKFEQPTAEPTAAPMVTRSDTGEHPSHAEDRHCSAVKTDGERCHAKALAGSSRCFFHDPESADERSAASKRGGEKNRRTTLPPDTPDFTLANADDASALIARTINQMLRGEIDHRIATAVGYLVTVKMKATDAGTLERRVAALEVALHNTRSNAENGGSL